MIDIKKYVSIAAIVLMALFIGNYIGSCSKQTEIEKFNERLEIQKDSTRKVLAHSDSVKKASDARIKFIQDSTKQIDDSLNKVIAKRNYQLTIMRQKNDSTLEAIKADTSCNDTCKNAVKVAEDYRSEADTAKAQVVDIRHKWELSEINLLAMTKERDSTNAVVNELRIELKKWVNLDPPKDPDKIFGIKLPSRTASFFIGVGIGTVTAIASGKVFPNGK